VAGYIGIDRGIVNHWIYKDPEYFKTWFEILYRARYSRETGTELIEGQLVEINYGEFIFGRIKWSDRIGISERRLRTLMDKLIADEMITLVKRAPKFSIYSVNNYAKYRQQNDQHEDLEPQGFECGGDQQNVQQTTSKRPASDQQVTTKEKGSNKVNKDKKVNKKDIIPKINFAEFVSMTQEEYDKLLEAHEQDKLNRIIETLDNYKGSTGKKYTSDYRAILNWVVSRVEEDERKLTLVKGGGNGGKYQTGYAGVSEASRKAASRGAETFIGSPGRESGLTTEEVQRRASNFE
jgi:hypothetical protein